MVAAPYENDQNYFILYQVIKKDCLSWQYN
jgi:hypothetical protein